MTALPAAFTSTSIDVLSGFPEITACTKSEPLPPPGSVLPPQPAASASSPANASARMSQEEVDLGRRGEHRRVLILKDEQIVSIQLEPEEDVARQLDLDPDLTAGSPRDRRAARAVEEELKRVGD